MITAFAGSKAAEAFLENVSWRWGFGAFAIILPFVAAPLYTVLRINLRKAKKRGLISHERSNRSFLQTVWKIIVECDGEYMIQVSYKICAALMRFSTNSTRSHPIRGRPYGFLAAIHSRHLCPPRMENRLYHCHDRGWLRRPRPFRPLSDLSGSTPFLNTQVFDRSNRHWSMPHQHDIPSLILLLEQLFYVLPTGRLQPVRCQGWIR